MGAMPTTDTRTASQIITDEVTAWPGVEAGIGTPRRVRLHGRPQAARPPARRHTPRTSASPRPCGRSSTTPGRITYHPVFPDKKGWAARRIESDDDVRDVIAMLRLNYERAVA